MRRARGAVVLALLLAACGDEKLSPQPLGDTGFVVDVPAGWKVSPQASGEIWLDSQKNNYIIPVDLVTPEIAADAAARATGCTKAKRHEALPTGGDLYACGSKLTVLVPIDATRVAKCWQMDLIADEPNELATRICRSIRKK